MHAFRQDPLGLSGFLCVVCEARLGPPGCYLCGIHRTHGPFAKSSILLFKPVATVKSFLATLCASSLTVLYPYIEQRQGQASSNHRVGLRSRLDLKSRSRKRRPTRLQVMIQSWGRAGDDEIVILRIIWPNFLLLFCHTQAHPFITRCWRGKLCQIAGKILRSARP
jgi:hypothetical protein